MGWRRLFLFLRQTHLYIFVEVKIIMYGKFFSSTFTGSMFGAGADVFAVWAYVIANVNNSTVELNPNLIAAIIGITPAQVDMAIDFLCSPDPRSRNSEKEGCRLIKQAQFQYYVVSYEHYKAIRSEDERREYNRLKMRESRQRNRKNVNDMSITVNDSVQRVPPCTHIEEEVEEEKINTLSLFGEGRTPNRSVREEVIGKAWEYYRSQFGRRADYSFSETRKSHAEKAWKSLGRKCTELGIPEEEQPAAILDWMCAAIEFMKADKFHNGQNDQHTKYNDWENLFTGSKWKSPDKLTDHWLNGYKFPNRGVKL